MLTNKEILELFDLNQVGLQNIYYAVYGTKVAQELWTDVSTKYEHEDTRAVCKSVHQLYMDADDTASYVQHTLWDVVTMLGVTEYADTSDLSELIKAGNTVRIASEPVEKEKFGEDDMD